MCLDDIDTKSINFTKKMLKGTMTCSCWCNLKQWLYRGEEKKIPSWGYLCHQHDFAFHPYFFIFLHNSLLFKFDDFCRNYAPLAPCFVEYGSKETTRNGSQVQYSCIGKRPCIDKRGNWIALPLSSLLLKLPHYFFLNCLFQSLMCYCYSNLACFRPTCNSYKYSWYCVFDMKLSMR